MQHFYAMEYDVEDNANVNTDRKRRNEVSHLQQAPSSFSKFRNSIGFLFSGPPMTKAVSHDNADTDADYVVLDRDEVDSTSIRARLSQTQRGIARTAQVERRNSRETDELGSDADLTLNAQEYNSRHAEDYYTAKLPYRDQNRMHFHSDATRSQETAHTSTRFPVKRLFRGLSRSRRAIVDRNRDSDSNLDGPISIPGPAHTAPLASTAVFQGSSPFPLLSSDNENQTLTSTARSSELETPPLTPDSLNNQFLPSFALPSDSFESFLATYRYPFESSVSNDSEAVKDGDKDDDDDDGFLYSYRRLMEVREGKKPERYTTPETAGGPSTGVDDADDWYGLEYTLEVSSRERQPSGTQSFSAGEHSKSRESWAAIHRGRIHPFFEDEDYHQWKNWHRFLDHQDERKRHRKGYEFKARSKDLAWLYVDEIRTRDVLHWQKEVFGMVARDVKERLQYIVERRPDPSRPTGKHQYGGWYLKRSRSLACLRELKPKEPITGTVNKQVDEPDEVRPAPL